MKFNAQLMTLFFIFFLFPLTSCSKKSSSNKRETRIEEAQIQEVMDNQNFECASLGGSCPEGIARLLIINRFEPDRSSVCTGFMITPNKLVTNNHCVRTAEECRNTYIAVYNGADYVKTKCKRILKTQEDRPNSNDPRRKIDYTIMETANVFSGEVLTLSSTLAAPGDLIHSWVVDHTGLDSIPSNLTESRITEFDCRVQDQTERASLVLENCPIISGNSGSPALNTRGEVIGVIWGGSANAIDSSFDLDSRRDLEEIATVTEVNFIK